MAGSALNPSGGAAFDPDAPEWIQYHVLDLKGVSASFQKYLSTAKPNDPAAVLMTARLDSITRFIKRYDENPSSADFRTFSPIPVHYQSWRLRREDFTEEREVGQGASATVYYGRDTRSGRKVAVKKLRFKKLEGESLRQFQREVSILATAAHPCLLGFVGATDSAPFCILTDWMAGGTLFHEVHKPKRLNATTRTIAAFDIARGMQFLHSCRIVHRDLKSLNVLLDENGRAHICDFGFSRLADEGDVMTQNIGTPHWMAPELLTGDSAYTSKVDVYAYGVVLWEIACGQLPYHGMDPAQIVARVLMHNARPLIPDTVGGALRALIVECWDRNPDARPTFDQIVHRFVRDRIVLAGGDIARLEQYVQETVGMSTARVEELESLAVDESEAGLIALIEILGRDKIPEQLVGRCWSMVERNSSASPSIRATAALLFINTAVKAKAAHFLRKLPCNSVSRKRISQAMELIPTGSEEFDKDLIVTACKNGAADAAAVCAFFPNHLKLALEIVGQHGVDRRLRAAVADRCVQCRGSKDPATVCAAIRCLIGIGEARRMTLGTIQHHMANRSLAARNCGLIAGAALAMAGIDMTPEIIDHVLTLAQDEIVSAFLVAACNAPHSALHLVGLIAYENPFGATLTVRMLMVAVKHEETRPAVMIALKRLHSVMKGLRKEWAVEVDQIQEFMNRQ